MFTINNVSYLLTFISGFLHKKSTFFLRSPSIQSRLRGYVLTVNFRTEDRGPDGESHTLKIEVPVFY